MRAGGILPCGSSTQKSGNRDERRTGMKHQILTLFTAGVLCASLTAGAFAGPPTANTEQDRLISQLEQKAHRLAWDAQTTKGAPRALQELQSLQVKKLIQR